MPTNRRSRSLVAGLVVVALAATGYAGWRWNHHRAERAEALELAAQKKYAEAEPRLKTLSARDPDDAEVVIALARLMVARGAHVVDAEPYWSRWCELRPDEPEAFHGRLDLWLRLKDYPRALADADRLASLEPANDDVALTRARLLALVGRFDEADAEAARLLAARPGDSNLTYVRCEILYQAGARDRAAALLDPLVARGYAPAVVLRGVLYAQADPPDPDRAIPLLRQGVQSPARAPERNLARYHLAQMLFRAGKADEANQELETHRQGQLAERLIVDAGQQPGNLDLHVRAARACLTAGMTADAEELLRKALSRDADYRPAHEALADLYEKQGDRVRAAEHRKRAGG
jgi:predicted Zn-dependent protease